jgi:CheY-like chemotaxis protein
MTRFSRTPTPIVHATVALTTLVVFAADLVTPLGIAVWVFYLVPVVIAYFGWRPLAPLAVALVATVLTSVGYLLSPTGIEPFVARWNRSFGIATVWTLALIGHEFIRAKLAVRRQDWLQSGSARLSEVMSGNPSLETLSANVLRTLAETLGATAGALFVESGGFRRIATYGVPQGAGVPDAFVAGDGLLGQAVVDRRAFVVASVPEGYLRFGSALGHATPRHLLVAPFAADSAVLGVVELGFLAPVDEVDLALLERSSGAVAVGIRSAQYREQLQSLLEETQRQAEELEAQSEELRHANEELEEQARALQSSQARLEQQQAELEETNAQLEEQAQQLELRNEQLGRAKSLLEQRTDALAEASRYKSEFLANMSHELRTPLNSSLILARLLADNRNGNLTAEQVRYARTIETAGNDLLALINDVLDLAKVEAGRLEAKPQTLVIARLVEHLRASFQPLADEKKLLLRFAVAPDVPAAFETDPQRLEQVLRNLLGNAIKFTESGEVALAVACAPDHRIAFAVRDTGVGIPADQHERIFEPFLQAGSGSGPQGGTGLGLAISRELARLLGGEIRIESAVGAGSTFTVILPERFGTDPATTRAPASTAIASTTASAHAVPDAASRPTPPLPSPAIEDDRERLDAARRLLLVVEDDLTFAGILRDLAREASFQAIVATTADEALALAARHAPAAVLLDVALPDVSGLTVLDRLKRDPRTRHVPVHMVSVHDYAHTALSLGAAGYMLKPVKREALVEAFRRLEAHLARKVRRVLVVEDDPVQRDALAKLLAAPDVETEVAADAAIALARLHETVFDCMVLDLNLPGTTGFELLETMSREERYSFPPVIVYTGRELSADDEQRLRRHSQSVIIKGARSPERLLDEVTLFLHQVVSELPQEQRAMLERARSRDAVLEGRHVLLVEDDVRNVFALTSVLEPLGARVQIARNGREALEALDRARAPDAAPVDLVLMDVMMPEMDGLTATREIRKRPEWRKLPVIVLTAKAMRGDHEHALAAGASDYLAKPLDVDKLLSLMRVWMPR